MFADVEGSNIVGYCSDNTASPAGFKFIAPAFIDCGGTQASVLTALKPVAVTGEVPDGSSTSTRIKLQVLDANGGAVGDSLGWRVKSGVGAWYKWASSSSQPDVKLDPGQSVMITFPVGCNNCTIQFNGQVYDKDVYYPIQSGFTFVGNTTPLSINVQDFILVADEGYEVPTGSSTANRVKLQVLDEHGGVAVGYDALGWRSPTGKATGWYKWSSSSNMGSFSIAPGQGFLISYSGPEAGHLKIKIPAPKLAK